MTGAIFYTAHSVARAKQHYGLDLHHDDMMAIWRACREGRASRMQTSGPTSGDPSETFVYRHKGRVVIPVIAFAEGKYFITTFLPPDHFAAGTSRKRFCKKQVHATAKRVDGREYRRARANREAMKDTVE